MCEVPIRCLGKDTKDLISLLLNPKKIIPNEKGLSRDWSGLAELCDIGGERIRNIQSQTNNDYTLKVLEIWSEKNKDECTIERLLSFLQILDRFDVVDDIADLIERDVERYRANPNGFKTELHDMDDLDIITYDDADRKRQGLPLQIYDAFVLFDDDDIAFATEIIETMESQYNMKLCVKDRDVHGGGVNHDSVIRLIVNRCHRVIVVVSPSFLGSPTNKYFYTLASMEGIERQKRKIIPCIYKRCLNLPVEFKAYHILDFERSRSGTVFGNFWDQLHKSLRVFSTPSPASLREVSSVPVFDMHVEEVQNNISETPKAHVTFAEVDSPQETKEEVVPESPELPTVNDTPSCQTVPEVDLKKIKKKNSILSKCKNLLNQKKKVIEDKTEVPVTNGLSKKKKFWKRNKIKEALPN